MDVRTIGGAAGTLLAAAAVGVGIGGLVAGSSGELLAPTAATLAVVAVAVLALIGLGVRDRERPETPYW